MARSLAMALWDSAERSAQSPCSHPWLAQGLFALDARLRRRHAVLDYTTHPSCIFRLDIARCSRAIVLRDGTRLRRGHRIIRLHFWNEHIPAVSPHGATIGWARQMQRCIAISLHELAHYLLSRPDLYDITVICGDVPSGTMEQTDQIARIMARYGFETINQDVPLSIGQQLHQFGENILISLIVFVQNAGALRFDSLRRVRVPIFLSRRTLAERFENTDRPGSRIAMARHEFS